MNLKSIALSVTTALTCSALVACNPQQTSTESGAKSALAGQNVCGVSQPELGPLHVASPEWQDQIIYFLMIDRFNDGNPTNNDQGVGIYEKGAANKYNGGDLQGITDKLDYIQDLGATAVWTTPQVANQWWDPVAQYWGYHGYWARDFKAVDEHYGCLTDYQNLSRALHGRGMYLIQDIVVNHTGNFFHYDGEYDPDNPTANFKINSQSVPVAKPDQFPLSLNDAEIPQQKELAIYNWTPVIRDNTNRNHELNYALAGLDDMNTRNPVVREMLKDSYRFWLDKAGVDGFRVDTAKYVDAEFYDDFLNADNGIRAKASELGRKDFLTFGEIFETSMPNDDYAERLIAKYLGDEDKPRLDSPIGFPLYKEMEHVFATGFPTSYMTYRLNAAMKWYKNPYTAVNFVDNHDVERFLAKGSMAAFKQAYALMMTVPGIPVIYQGDEQAHLKYRQTMFAGGHGSETDQFDTQADMFGYIQQLIKLRKNNPLFSRGDIQVHQDNAFGPGVLAYSRTYQGETAFVIFNSADKPALLTNLQTGFNPDAAEILLYQGVEDKQKVVLSKLGSLTYELPARAVLIIKGKQKHSKSSKSDSSITIDDLQAEYLNQDELVISGTAPEAGSELKVILDGNYADATSTTVNESGKWQVKLSGNDLGTNRHSIAVYWPEQKLASKTETFVIKSTRVSSSAGKTDPKGDDKGLTQSLILPKYQQGACYLDFTEAKAEAGGSKLNLILTLCDISTAWKPSNGFDHLALNIYFDIPGREGVKSLPLLNGEMPDNADWDIAHSSFGWGNYVFTSDDATANQEGNKLNYSPRIVADKQKGTITFSYRGDRMGVKDWSGVKIYITSWDKDEGGHYRDINQIPSNWHFAGSERTKIADSVTLTLTP